jgi:hypothetical protein
MKRKKLIFYFSMIVFLLIGLVIAEMIYRYTVFVRAITGFTVMFYMFRFYTLPTGIIEDERNLEFKYNSRKIFRDIATTLFTGFVGGLALNEILGLIIYLIKF